MDDSHGRKTIEEIVQEIQSQGISYKEGAKRFNIDVKEIYTFNHRQIKEEENLRKALKKKLKEKAQADQEVSMEAVPDAPVIEKIPALPEGVQELILDYRKAHPDHGYKRIEEYLKKTHFVVIQRKKIRQVLKAHGLSETLDSSFDRKDDVSSKKGVRRFEAAFPCELYQMDVTYIYLAGIPVLYLVVIIDDYSRFCVAAELRHDQKGTTMIDVLHRAIGNYGKPVRLLTDQGSSFYTWSHESTLFQKYLDDMEIEHIVADPHSPQTLGKVERTHQTIQREVLKQQRFNSFEEARSGIQAYIHDYNYNRPHQGIGGAFPADRFHGVISETSRIEASLHDKSIDFSKGYLIFKNQDHMISMVCSRDGIQIYLNGQLLKGEG